jgi:hypothetical protein
MYEDRRDFGKWTDNLSHGDFNKLIADEEFFNLFGDYSLLMSAVETLYEYDIYIERLEHILEDMRVKLEFMKYSIIDREIPQSLRERNP